MWDEDITMLETEIDRETIYTLEEIKKRLEPVFRARNVKKAILFGSYAKNTAHRKSDVDILVDSGLRGLRFCGLAYGVGEALAKVADVYDVYYLDKGSPMGIEISQTGVAIYESE
jgi:predicted nucleotidyltransferase